MRFPPSGSRKPTISPEEAPDKATYVEIGFEKGDAVSTGDVITIDAYRAKGTKHSLMKDYKIDAVPFKDPRMEEWRDALRRGVQFYHEPTNLILRGGVDDIWVTPDGALP